MLRQGPQCVYCLEEVEAQEPHGGHCVFFTVLASVAGQIPTFLFYVCCFVTKLLRCVCIPYFPCCPEITPGQSNLMERRNLRLLPVRKQRRMEAMAQPLSLLRSQSLSQRMVSPTVDRSSLLKERNQDNPPPLFLFIHSRGPPSTFQEILDHQVGGQY